MLRLLLVPLLLLACAAWGQAPVATVTIAQLDAATEKVTTTLAEDDPERATLLKLYSDTRAALVAAGQYADARESYARARAGAAREARAIAQGLAERETALDDEASLSATAPLAELEQRIQVRTAELDARKSKQAEIQAEVDGVPARAVAIRDRLTKLGTLIPDLQARIALLPQALVSGTEEEANAWLARAQLARSRAEKAALDEELLSQPMRLQLLAARLDRATQDISGLERQLQAMGRRDAMLRQGAATEAHSEAQKALEDTRGKHQLVRELADRNATLSAIFVERGQAIESVRQREQVIGNRAERLENDLKTIEHKLSVLGMNTKLGHVLREQRVRMPKGRDTKNEIERVSEQMTVANVHQIELEDEVRNLLDAKGYVDGQLAELDYTTAQLIRDDMLELASKRRELVKQALDLENVYTEALGKLDFSLRRYAIITNDYRHFIDERLLWIPSRDPFSLFRLNGLPSQLAEVFAAERWVQELRQLRTAVVSHPLLMLAALLFMALVYYTRRLKGIVILTGREVGYVRTDAFANTILALGLSLVMSVQWPLLLWIVSQLFELQAAETELGVALHTAFSRGALYLWPVAFARILLMPKGVIAAHFRWPAQRAALVHKRIVVLARTFVPATMLGVFSLSLYPAEVGGPLGAVAIILVLLSMAYFFRRMPEYMHSKISVLFTDTVSTRTHAVGRVVRQSLVWAPVVTTVAVLFGYIYTAMVFSLLLVKTAAAFALVFLFNELGLRWLRMTRRRMLFRARAEAARASTDEGEVDPEEETLENDPELLSGEGTKLINLLTLLGLVTAIVAIWSEVLPALGVFDSVQLWHQMVMVDGEETLVPVSLADAVTALLIAVLGWMMLRRVPGLLEIFLRKKMDVRPASAYAITRVFQYAATAALVIGVLSSLGGSWSQIQWAVAALSVGIGFGLQEIVANFISGLIILFEQPIRVGDIVTVGNISGKVTKIRIRATTIRDFDRRELLVPNKEFITQQLLNWSLSDQVTRWKAEVGVAYGTDLEKAMTEVREAVAQQPLILKDPEPIVTFELFGDNSLLICARYFMDQLDQRLQVSSDLMLDINRRLNAQGIVVAFPQRDVHLDTSQPLEIRMLQRETGPEQEHEPKARPEGLRP